MGLRQTVKKVISAVVGCFPTSKTIVFESAPVYTDNARAVVEEMIRRGWQKKYKFVWVCPENAVIPENVDHVSFVKFGNSKKDKLRRLWLMYTARAFISCNSVLPRYRKGQYAICLMHGAALKRVTSHYNLPEDLDDILGFSEYLMPYEKENTGAPIEKVRLLGFPRNDALFDQKADLHKLFPDSDFEKFVYWMPTYRQHNAVDRAVSNIAMPILYNEEIAAKVNDCAKENKVLVVVKPHYAQDVSRIKVMDLPNLKFIDDQFLADTDVAYYDLLAKADALLTDYSSVYYDYLLMNRPIGLCWDDYAEYKKREGFVVDENIVLAGGEKIYTADELNGFIGRVAAGEDVLKAERQEVLDMIHVHKDNKSSQRVVDHIEKQLAKL